MMKHILRILVNVIIIKTLTIICITNINAQANISCELRPKFEYRNGYKTLRDSSSNPAFVSSQRTRLNFEYKKDNIQTFISAQDVRVWGEEKNKADVANVLLHQGWMEMQLSDHYSFKLGRQEMKYDDERLISRNNWNNVSSSHDLALFKYNHESWNAHLGMAYNNHDDIYFESNYPINYYKTLSFLWLSKKVNDHLNASLICIADGNQKKGSDKVIYLRATSGGNFNYNNDSVGVKIDLAAYYQTGKDITGTKVAAYFFHAKTAYSCTRNLDVGLGLDYFSGNDETDTTNNINNAFSNLYGSGHRFSGSMDYFTSIDKHTLGGGLIDYYTKILYAPSKKLSLVIAYHYFLLSGKLQGANNDGSFYKISPKLGSEIDCAFNLKINNTTKLQLGYSTMLARKSMEYLKTGSYNKYTDWGWLMFTINI